MIQDAEAEAPAPLRGSCPVPRRRGCLDPGTQKAVRDEADRYTRRLLGVASCGIDAGSGRTRREIYNSTWPLAAVQVIEAKWRGWPTRSQANGVFDMFKIAVITKKTNLSSALLSVLLLIISGCGTYIGDDFDQNKLSGLIKGKTNYRESSEILGRPSSIKQRSNGFFSAEYQYLHISDDWLHNLIHQNDTLQKHATLFFTPDGILEDWTFDQTASGDLRTVPPDLNSATSEIPITSPLSSISDHKETSHDATVWSQPTSSVASSDKPLSDRRIALVIGNSKYGSVDTLKNPANDARLIADTLKQLGYRLIEDGAILNLTRNNFEIALQAFGRAIVGADIALFYYAGHGMQVDDNNWLVPIDASIDLQKRDLPFHMISASNVLLQMEESGAQLNLIVLDACRNNPFANRGLRGAGGGLAEMRAPAGSLIAYSTQPGNIALDGEGSNSPYSGALAAAMQQRDLDIFHLFNRVGLNVQEETHGAQVPWVSTSPIRSDIGLGGVQKAP